MKKCGNQITYGKNFAQFVRTSERGRRETESETKEKIKINLISETDFVKWSVELMIRNVWKNQTKSAIVLKQKVSKIGIAKF